MVWVDDQGEASQTLRTLRATTPESAFQHVTSTHEMMIWLEARRDLAARDLVRVVTNSRRERDGGDEAAQLLVAALRKDSALRKVKVLVFCGNPKRVAHLEDKKR